MRMVIADEFMTLDGVVQAPSYPDEDVARLLAGCAAGSATARRAPEHAAEVCRLDDPRRAARAAASACSVTAPCSGGYGWPTAR
jgi:hypothetical protein